MTFKNLASQKIAVFAFDTTTSLPKTGDAANITAYVSKDYGTATVLGDTSATEMDATNAKGWYLFDLTQAETNADALLFTGKSSTANVSIVGGGLIFTNPPNFSALSITSGGSVAIVSGVKKNTAISFFRFWMTLTGGSSPATGKTVTVTVGKDGSAQGAGGLSAVTEIGGGEYWCSFAAGDTNATCVEFMAVASGCNSTTHKLMTDA